MGNISKGFTIDSMKKTGLKGCAKVFSVGYSAIDTSNILDIHRCLMKEIWYKIILGLIKKAFNELLSFCTHVIFSRSLHSKESLKNHPCKARPTLVNKSSGKTLFHRFTISLNKFGGSCNTIDDSYARVFVRNKVNNMNVI